MNSRPGGRRAKVNQQQLAAVLERINDGVVVFDAQMNYIYVNKRGGELLGRAPEDLVGKNYWEEYPEAKGTPFANAYLRALETQETIFFENYDAPWKRWFENRIYPSPDGLTILFTEITERKVAQGALQSSNANLRAIFNNTLESFIYLDYQGNIQTFNKIANDRARAIYGRGLSAGESILNFTTAAERPDFERNFSRALKGESVRVERPIQTITGSKIWFEFHYSPVYNEAHSVNGVFFTVSDISERKRAEQLLKTELQVLEKISSGAPLSEILETIVLNIEALSKETIASILLLDPDGIHVRYGAAPHLPTGYNQAIEGRPIGPQAGSCGTAMSLRKSVIVTDIETDPFWDEYRELARQHGLRACWSTPVIDADGMVLASFALYYREPRSPQKEDFILIERATHMVQIAVERKQAQEKLRFSEQQFSNVFYSGPAGMTITRAADGKFIDANQTFCQMFEFSRDEVVGQTSTGLKMWTPEERQRIITEQRRAGGLQNFELRAQSKSGRGIDILFSSRPMELAGELHYVTTMVDISARKQAEERVVFQSFLLENINDAIIATDANFNITSWNRAAETIFGWTAEEVLGQPISEIMRSEWSDEQRSQTLKQLSEQHQARFEVRVKRKDGQSIWVASATTALRGEKGAITGYVSIQRDVTERKHAEERVKKHLQQLAALHAIDMAISSNTELQVTFKILLEHVATQLGVDAAAVLLVNANLDNTLEFAAGRGFRGSGISQLKLKWGEDYAGQAALERRLVSISNLPEAERPLSKAYLTQGEDFVSYHAMPLIAKGQAKGVLEVFHRAPLTASPEWLDYFETLASEAAIAIDNAQLFEGLKRSNTNLQMAYETTIEGWSRALDLRDKETEGHTLRVTETTLRLARAAGMTDDELAHIKRGALLHDIGKLGVPDRILLKPDKLSADELLTMQKHPVYAYELLSPIAYLQNALDIPYCHHEKWDGTGYPRGLKGEQIPLAARLFAVVDVWDALTNERPYRKAWTQEKTLRYILEQAGKHFDPQAVALFVKIQSQN